MPEERQPDLVDATAGMARDMLDADLSCPEEAPRRRREAAERLTARGLSPRQIHLLFGDLTEDVPGEKAPGP